MALTLKQALAMFWEQIQVRFVKREDGKGLSTNDFTMEEKNKLASLENTTVDTTLTIEGAAADAKAVGEALAGKQPIGEYALKDDVVQPDWSQNDETAADYVKNRTHYVESVEEIINLPETTLELLDGSSDEFAITTPFLAPIEVDTTYNIVYNGSKYECKAQSFTAGAQTATVLGNVGAQTGGADTGEPFVVIVTPDELVSEVGYHAMFEVSDGAETATISISTTKEIVKTIDPKYLANGKDKHKYLTTDENGNTKWEQMLTWEEDSVVEVLPETEFTFDDSGESGITEPVAKHPDNGNICVVTFNGVEYKTVATEVNDNGLTGIVMGNLSKMGIGTDTGEPFVIIIPSEEAVASMGGLTFAVMAPDSGLTSATVSVKENTKVYRKISQQFLPTPDWNAKEGEEGYIANRTHYAYSDLVEILPECTVTEADQSAMSTPLSESLVEGKQYKVMYNGVEYDTTASIVDMNGIALVWLGNVGAMMGGADTGEPFVFAEAPADLAAEEGVYWQVQPLDDATSVTIKIVSDGEVVKRIDKKYLPQYDWNASKGEDGYIENRTHYVNQTDVEIMPETTFTGISGELTPVNATINEFVAGTSCVVTWNGVDYECEICSGLGFVLAYVGNGNVFGGTKTDDPFCFATLTAEGVAQAGASYFVYSLDGSTTATMKIIEPTGAVHRLDKKFIPSDLMDGYVPVLRTINGKYLKEDISLKASDVNAVPTTRTVNGKALSNNITLSAVDVNAVPTTRTVNGKTLSSDITLSASDVNALPSTTVIPSIEGLATETYVDEKLASVTGSVSSVNGKTGAVELTAADVGALPSSTVIPSVEGFATESYVDEKVAGLVESAPETLNTINELAAALGDDPNFATTVSTQIGNKVDKTTTINGKSLSSNITLTAANVGADPAGTAQAKVNNLNIRNGAFANSLRTVGAAVESEEYSLGPYAFAEGFNTKASGTGSHAEGDRTTASGYYTHAEGYSTAASNYYAHAEGCSTAASGQSSHAEGDHTTASGMNSHAEGYRSFAVGKNAHAEGGHYSTPTITLTGEANSVEYICDSDYALVGRHVMTNSTPPIIACITAVNINGNGQKVITLDKTLSTEAFIDYEAIIYLGAAYGNFSHSEGESTLASGNYSHAEGQSTIASGDGSHAEGLNTTASGSPSHAEGRRTIASGNHSHAEGYYTKASGQESHAEGYYTIAASLYQHVQGRYNVEDADRVYAHIVGNGGAENSRSNAHTLDWQGNAWFQGSVYVGGTSRNDAAAERLARTSDIAAPRDYIALTDQVTGKIYRLTMENGSLVTTLVEGGE